jgi:antitoxin (DNA-binding transcriptional repressor) of toxin-antitoxin stability system
MIQQTKILPASQVKNNFGAIVSKIRTGVFTEVIVENRGEPIVAIVTMADLTMMKDLREKRRQKEALTLLRKARAQVQARIKGTLTEKKANTLANRFSSELIEDLEKKGKVAFE